MDWKKEGKRVTHKSGFVVIVDHGTFEIPNEISYQTKGHLSATDLAHMISAGLKNGRYLERQQKVIKSSMQRRPRLSLNHRTT